MVYDSYTYGFINEFIYVNSYEFIVDVNSYM